MAPCGADAAGFKPRILIIATSEHGAPTMKRSTLLLLLFALALIGGCARRVATPAMTKADCRQEIDDNFGPQRTALIAVAARDAGPLFRTEILESLDRVCSAFEEEALDDQRAVKCLTTVPIMYSSAMGTRLLIARDELPFKPQQSLDFQTLVHQLEFARGDVVDAKTGTSVSYIHLPLENYDEGSIEALFKGLQENEGLTLHMEIDPGTGRASTAYQRLANGGPSSAAILGLYDSGEDGGLKEPSALLAIDRFQLAAERQPRVAQSFSIADVIKLVRRGLHRGLVTEAFIPPVRAEISQLLLALSMSPNDGGFGPTIDSRDRVALLRINLSAQGPEQRRATAMALERALAREVQPGARAHLCLDY